MKRLSACAVNARWSRGLLLRPEATKNPRRYPLGFVPLDGTEPLDAVYSLLKSGHFVAPQSKIECIHKTFVGTKALCQSEHPIVSAQDVVNGQVMEKEILGRILIRRDFWSLEDFNDPELNSSYGVQNLYFDNYKWSQVLWKRFQLFVEEYYPVSEHSHLTYTEYMRLIRSFSIFEQGAHVTPVLPRKFVVHPPYGVVVPSKFSLEPLLLYKRWLHEFRTLLALHKALVVRCGSGVGAFATRLCGVPMVRGVDPSPRTITACRADAEKNKLTSMSFRVAEFFEATPEQLSKGPSRQPALTKYNLIMYYPDEDVVAMFADDGNDPFAPTGAGQAGNMEHFFERAADFLSDTGVLVVCCTNIQALLRPTEPHPVEYEVKVNRRFVLLDYYDAPMRFKGPLGTSSDSDPRLRAPVAFRQKLRSELWVLHKLESIQHFGFLHGIPGAKPPATLGRWKNKDSARQRQKVLRDHVTRMGGDWGEYKQRLVKMLQEQSDEPEDDVAEAVRMALDPQYPAELARKAKAVIDQNKREKDAFHETVHAQFTDRAPRELFDARNF